MDFAALKMAKMSFFGKIFQPKGGVIIRHDESLIPIKFTQALAVITKYHYQNVIIRISILYVYLFYFSEIHIFSGISAESSAPIYEYANMFDNN